MSQQGKVALVTGGAQGIGKAFVESLLAEGASVAVCDIKKEVGEALVDELTKVYGKSVIFLLCDVTNDYQFEKCFKTTIERFSSLDIVVNNAGTANERENGWRRVIDINLVSVIRGTQLGMKYMGKLTGGKGGIIVNVASITALEPFPSIPVYSATKAAVNQFSRSYGHELYFKKSGVKVLAINPGMTETDLAMSSHKEALVDDPDVIENFTTHFGTFHVQHINNMGRGLIDVLQKGENGSLWTIENDEPAKLTLLK